MSADISKTELPTIIQSGKMFFPARDNVPGLVSNLTYEVWKRHKWKRAVAEKGFTLVISNEDMNDIIKIIKIIRRFGCITWWSYWNNKSWNKTRQISWSLVSIFSCFICNQ